MGTKLTLRLDRDLIERAKRYARSRDKSVSRLVADYFALLGERGEKVTEADLPPVTRELLGSLSGSDVDEEDYRRHLEDKHG